MVINSREKLVRGVSPAPGDASGHGWPWGDKIPFPGLTDRVREIHELEASLPRDLAIFSYKQRMPCLWVVFVGGTGTGKSTLFNALCGETLSDTGVERPKTCGPVLYAYRDCPMETSFPFPRIPMKRIRAEGLSSGPISGVPGYLLVLEHNRENCVHLVLIDTPDLDSVEKENRQMAESLYLLADGVVFITSQEKYADEVPYRFLMKLIHDRKPYFFLLNKVIGTLKKEDVLEALRTEGVRVAGERMWAIPYLAGDPSSGISRTLPFQDFLGKFHDEFSPKRTEILIRAGQKRRAENLKISIDRLLDALQEEDRASEAWLADLKVFYEKACEQLIQEQKERSTVSSREYLRTEIRKLFNRYDVFSKPRRMVRGILYAPLRLLGIYGNRTKGGGEEALCGIRQKVDVGAVQAALERFNRRVMENLCPQDQNAPFFMKLHQPGLVLGEEEIREELSRESDKLASWLQETFKDLSRGIPRTKQFGIYSTAILWGILILAFEVTIGGGFSVVDAALDSALAPFVTKGAVELFAYREIQKIAYEMAVRYQQALVSVLDLQRERYERGLGSLRTPRKSLDALRTLKTQLSDWQGEATG